MILQSPVIEYRFGAFSRQFVRFLPALTGRILKATAQKPGLKEERKNAEIQIPFRNYLPGACATFALAQTGSIQGTVTDSVGAVVQGAEVTVKNLGSNATRTVTSGGTGAYSVPSLAPGAYDVTVKMASFKAFHVADLPLTVGQTLLLNVQLEPGAVTEEVQVRADQIPDVDLETSQVSNLVDERAIKTCP